MMNPEANRGASGTGEAGMGGAHLECIGLTKAYGALVVVNDVNLKIAHGETRAVIGPNGAGKSSLFNAITGVVKPSSGSVLLNGKDNLVGLPIDAVCRKGMARTFQLTSIFPEATVYQNILVAALAARTSRWWPFVGRSGSADGHKRTDKVLERLRLTRLASSSAGSLSHGDQRVLEIAMALAQDPEILFLDEPTQGLSIEETERTIEMLKALKASGNMTIVLIEHDMEVVFQLADKIAVLHRGRVIADGAPATVKEDPKVQDAYLGGLD